MSTKAEIRSQDYQRMTFEHDAEFGHGEIVERAMPDEIHAAIQFLILLHFGRLIHSYPVYPRPEIRMKVGPNAYHVADIAVFAGAHPLPVPETPPLAAIEILSKDDRYGDIMQKLEGYREWGVANIWVIDPSLKRFSTYTEFGLQNVSSLGLADYSFQVTHAEVFACL
jgi:Uma2 family endonuclease